MAYKQFLTPQGTKGFLVTPSDTVDIKADAANFDDVAFIYPHAVSGSGAARVLLAGMAPTDTPVQIYLVQGITSPHACSRIFLTTPTPPTTITGIY